MGRNQPPPAGTRPSPAAPPVTINQKGERRAMPPRERRDEEKAIENEIVNAMIAEELLRL